MSQVDNKFNFFIPVDLSKAGDGEKDWTINGVASYGGDVDSDGEVLDVKGMDCSEFIDRGYFNYNHSKDPRYNMLGKPKKVWIDKGNLMVEGKLFKDNETSKQIWKNAQILAKEGDGRSYGFSVEGAALERDPLNPSRVTKSSITNIAICERPKNARSLMNIVKGESSLYEEDDYELDEEGNKKALTTESASALIPESLDGNLKRYDFNLDKTSKNLNKSEIYTEIFSTFTENNAVVTIETAKEVYNLIDEVKKSLNMKEVNADIIKKAKDLLGLVEKSEFNDSGAPFSDNRGTDGAYESMLSEGTSLIKGYVEEGKEKDEAVKACSEKYPDLEKSDLEKAYDEMYSSMEDKKKKEEEDKGEMKKSEEKKELSKAEILLQKEEELKKSLEAVEALKADIAKEDELKKSEDLSKALGGVSKEAISEIIKSEISGITDKLEKSNTANDELSKENSELKKGLEEQSELIKGFQKQLEDALSHSPASKAPKTKDFLAKGEDPSGNLNKGERTLSVSRDKGEIVKCLEGMATSTDGGDPLVKAAADAEFGVVSSFAMGELKKQGIILTQ